MGVVIPLKNPEKATVWFTLKDNRQVGPLSEREILEWLNNGKISHTTLIWCEGMANWLPMSAVPEFRLSIAEI